MNIEARKIQFVQEFLKLKNEEIISHLQNILKIEVSNPLECFSIEEFKERIDKSEKDFKAGRIIENSGIKAKYL